ncbi:MAG: hypothetical protein K1X89_23095 [Myxococcaceae bacterium]|nr:hypothetical protein [Myxococcaceae bacterium]
METHSLAGAEGVAIVVVLAVLMPLGIWWVIRRSKTGPSKSAGGDASSLEPGAFPISGDEVGHHHHHHHGDLGGGGGGDHGGHHH